MRYVILMLVPTVALLLAADDQADKDKKALQGTWKVTSFEADGKSAPADVVKEMKVVIKDDALTISDGKRDEKGTFKLDATKKPKAIDLKASNSDDLAPGIYELDGDNLKICFRKRGAGERPKDFTDKEAAGILIMKREK